MRKDKQNRIRGRQMREEKNRKRKAERQSEEKKMIDARIADHGYGSSRKKSCLVENLSNLPCAFFAQAHACKHGMSHPFTLFFEAQALFLYVYSNAGWVFSTALRWGPKGKLW